MGVLTKHMFAAPTKPSELTPSGGQLGDLEAVILRALGKDPSARYATMGELAKAIERAIDVRASAAPKGPTQSGRTVAFSGPGALSTADRIQRSVSRHVEDEKRRKRRGIV